MRFGAVLALTVAMLAATSSALARPTAQRLAATVGPGETITLTRAGHPVKRLAAGTYTIVVRDLAGDHNFHLVGPGVNRATDVARTGTHMWHVTLRKGLYRFRCDPHASFMDGAFTVT